MVTYAAVFDAALVLRYSVRAGSLLLAKTGQLGSPIYS
jgi:hypothetical protein